MVDLKLFAYIVISVAGAALLEKIQPDVWTDGSFYVLVLALIHIIAMNRGFERNRDQSSGDEL